MNRSIVVTLLVVTLAFAGNAHAAFPDAARGAHGMAATANPIATAAALEVLQAGGNAVDAAIAATFAISVVEPFSAGIGGGGFAIVHLAPVGDAPAQTLALDFREKAPAGATRDMYLDKSGVDGKGTVVPGRSTDGYLSVAVPSTVPGLVELHKKHGKLAWSRLVQPAIRAARQGFPVGPRFIESFTWRRDVLVRHASTRAVFMKRDPKTREDVPLEVGDLVIQRDLAKTLQDIARDPSAMQTGRVAKAIAADVQKNGGVLTLKDLADYRPTWRDALCGDWRGLRVCSMPPPSSGGVHLLQILNLIGDAPLQTWGYHHPDALHLLIESMRTAYADRAVHLGDPAFVKVPVQELTSLPYAQQRRREIDPKKARKSSAVRASTPEELKKLGLDSPDTSHLVVVDQARNAVSLTFTVNYGFGSGVVVPGTGVLLNDEMDDFAAAPGTPNAYGLVGGEANSVQPGKIPLSSMTPLIATKEGRFALAAGAPGGSTIITTVLQTLLHVHVYGMDCQAAVAAPRLHQQWQPEATRIEPFGFDALTLRDLQARGHELKESDGWGNAMCVRDVDGVLEGGADVRGEGSAAGY